MQVDRFCTCSSQDIDVWVSGIIFYQKSSFSIFPVLKVFSKIKKIETIQNLLSLWVNHFLSNFNKIWILFWFFTETLTLSLAVSRWVGDNTVIPSNSNISETKSKHCLYKNASKEYLISFLKVCRLIDFALAILSFKVVELLGSQKLSFSIFLVLKGLNEGI